MNELQQYIDRKKDIVTKWERIGLLGGITDAFEKEQMALMLENQRLCNEIPYEIHDPFMQSYHPDFIKIAIPLVRRMFQPSSFMAYNIVSIQTLMAQEHSIFYRDKYGNLKAHAVRAKTSKLRHIPNLESRSLDERAKLLADYAKELTSIITGEIIRDLRDNAGTRFMYEWRTRQHMEDFIRVSAASIEKKSGYYPNWLIAGPSMAYGLLEQAVPDVADKTHPLPTVVGKLINKMTVYSSPRVSDETIILGYRGDQYTAGYFYCPYIPVAITPSASAPSPGMHYDYGILSRYGKSMPFPEFYGRIDVNNYSSTDMEA